MTYHPYDPIICEGRPALFLWWAWSRSYARVRFTDNNERRIVSAVDIGHWPAAVEQACVDAIREVFVLPEAAE